MTLCALVPLLAMIDSPGAGRLAMMLPLCLSIAVVYKTTRCEELRQVPLAALALWGTIVVAMYAVGVGLWIVFSILA